MRYCRLFVEGRPASGEVRMRAGEPWVERLLPPFEEDLAARLAAVDPAAWTPRPLAEVDLLPAVAPANIVCVGRNYADHARELGNQAPAEPLLFLKPLSSLAAHGEVVELPPQSARVDYEGELAIVIGRVASRLSATDELAGYIRGYTIVNDVTARDLQKSDGQWARAKGFDTFCPVGPVVSDEIDPLRTPVRLETRVDGQLRQRGSTADLLFPIPRLLEFITAAFTLEPGDLIATGTPAGVGPVQPGEQMEVEIEGIGVLRNAVAARE